MSDHANNITVYYDASCPKCVKDRKNYERMADELATEVCWVDITGRNDALRQLGIDPHKALTELHIKDQHGRILSEIDAYILLMKRVPRLRIIAWLIGLPVIRAVVAFAYHQMVNRRLRNEGRL